MDSPTEKRPLLREVAAPASTPTIDRHQRHWLWIVTTAAILSTTTFALVWQRASTPPPPSFKTAAVSKGDVIRQVTATGTVNPELTIIVGSYVSGPITDIQCDYNTVVTAGQICATIDPRPYQTIVDQDSANLSVADAQLTKDGANFDYAQLNYRRNQRLIATQAVSQDTVEVSKSLADQAAAQVALDQATIEQREAELSAAQINLDYTNIRSPVNGVVVSRNVTQGQTVAASFQTPTLFLIATDLTRMQVDTNVSESDIGTVSEGQSVTFSVDAFPDRIFEGKITQVRQSPQTIQNVVTFDAVVGVDNTDLALKPGMTASLNIITAHATNALRVPNQALRFEPTDAGNTSAAPTSVDAKGPHVWVQHNDTVIMVPVTIGVSDQSYTVIEAGELEPGDKIAFGEDVASSTMAPFRFLRW
ncbi:MULTISPECIES: efflux RND transporter periplasmic adaptor subunit [unclassified Rhizobium]|jgi:HlyD family secretion protein|uniref:efflux RND transporter periplasmic adaptor subunit n=1 Tax=unclassified Rhizobium TaxID=2613769 RepID=UPI0009E04385|nr:MULTISPECIES: efflux RND transporter periplasmic adaptor subunit [unclassified Rhizobium]RKD35546.1 HlyD family secretion protein [Rhizobium sp. WW_1]